MEKQTQKDTLNSHCSNTGILRVNNNPLGQQSPSFLDSQIPRHSGQEYKKIIHLHISQQGLIKRDCGAAQAAWEDFKGWGKKRDE